MDRNLKIYSSGSLIDTIDLNTDMGSALYNRIDRRIELSKIDTENTSYYSELYVPTFNFEFNESTQAIFTKILYYQFMQYDFVLQTDYMTYPIVLKDNNLDKYHPAYATSFKHSLVFECIRRNYVPGMQSIIFYDNIYTIDSPIGLDSSSTMELTFLSADLSSIFFLLSGTGTFRVQLYNSSGILTADTTLDAGSNILLPVWSGLNVLKISGIATSGVDTITNLKVYGV